MREQTRWKQNMRQKPKLYTTTAKVRVTDACLRYFKEREGMFYDLLMNFFFFLIFNDKVSISMFSLSAPRPTH
jgi:hypothetical protein